jgi:hypothetical protein
MGHDREWRAQHLFHAGHEDHRVDRACQDALIRRCRFSTNVMECKTSTDGLAIMIASM